MKPSPLVLACAAALVVDLPTTGGAVAAERDWSRVQLAWRDDPRPPADAPFEVEMPRGRRETRRANRRAAARRMPLDDLPVHVGGHVGDQFGGRHASPAPLAEPLPWIEPRPLGEQSERFDEPIVHRDQPSVPQPDSRQRFDILLPAGCAGTSRLPLVVWIHGDTWRDGSKADCPIRWLTDLGYAVASVGYRLSDAATFPAQLDDCRAAIATLVRDADTWGVDPTRICVIGRGTGGHLAALTALAEPAAGAADNVSAACAIAAPADLTNLGPAHVRETSAASVLVGGPLIELREAALAASPLAHVSADDPPLLLVHGGRDTQVPADQAARLEAACRAAGVDCRLVRVEAAAHDVALEAGTVAGTAVQTFLDRVLGAKIGAADRDAAPPAVP